MALYINNHNGEIPGTFHIGNPLNYVRPENVASIQCDGDELDHALAILGRDPLPFGTRVFKFYGEQAQTIIGNWTNVK